MYKERKLKKKKRKQSEIIYRKKETEFKICLITTIYEKRSDNLPFFED